MKLKQIILTPEVFLFIVLAIGMVLLTACSDGQSVNQDSKPRNGKLAFSIAIAYTDENSIIRSAAVLDCKSLEISKIKADVYDSHKKHLATGGPWDCKTGEGTIASVPTGTDRVVIVLGLDNSENVVFHGHKSDIEVLADNENRAGTVQCSSFKPTILTPDDQTQVNADAIQLEWNSVSGAADYQVVVKEVGNPTPVINERIKTTNFSPQGLHATTSYNWQIFAIDPYGNTGIGSQVHSMTVIENPVGTRPVAKIKNPSDGSMFSATETIGFVGSGKDSDGRDLEGASFVWSSDVDGEICIGAICSSSTLVAGSHLISLTVIDANGEQDKNSIIITIPPGKLPDTGQATYYGGIAGQDDEDADFTINPPSYTKLDGSGKALNDGAPEWAMVRDNVTGLIWEIKTVGNQTDIQHSEKQLGWQSIKKEFIDPMNDANIGGYSDWRLPTIHELYTIVYKGNSTPPEINEDYFPNTKHFPYWSSTTLARRSDQAWCLEFSHATIYAIEKTKTFHIRAVRGEITNSAQYNTDSMTVTDTNTGLMWQNHQTDTVAMNWKDALEYCRTLVLAGNDDWRLPNIKELQSIANYESAKTPAINNLFFSNTEQAHYWSSTTVGNDNEGYAYTVHFELGSIQYPDKTIKHFVRAVRGGR